MADHQPICMSERGSVKLQNGAASEKARNVWRWGAIVLGCADGMENRQVARQLRIADQTVCKWRSGFVLRLDGLADEPRPGTPRKITDGASGGADRTDSRDCAGAGHALVHKKHGGGDPVYRNRPSPGSACFLFTAAPHRTFKLSADPFFVEKVRDIVGLYLNPPERALVLCVDEKSQVQALDRTRPILPFGPALPARQTHDYLRHGTTSLFCCSRCSDGR